MALGHDAETIWAPSGPAAKFEALRERYRREEAVLLSSNTEYMSMSFTVIVRLLPESEQRISHVRSAEGRCRETGFHRWLLGALRSQGAQQNGLAVLLQEPMSLHKALLVVDIDVVERR